MPGTNHSLSHFTLMRWLSPNINNIACPMQQFTFPSEPSSIQGWRSDSCFGFMNTMCKEGSTSPLSPWRCTPTCFGGAHYSWAGTSISVDAAEWTGTRVWGLWIVTRQKRWISKYWLLGLRQQKQQQQQQHLRGRVCARRRNSRPESCALLWLSDFVVVVVVVVVVLKMQNTCVCEKSLQKYTKIV